jgi:hypothetical protein
VKGGLVQAKLARLFAKFSQSFRAFPQEAVIIPGAGGFSGCPFFAASGVHETQFTETSSRYDLNEISRRSNPPRLL